MPHAGGHVGDGVGVELVLLDPVGEVVLVPRRCGVLVRRQPLPRPLHLGGSRRDRAPWPLPRGSRRPRARRGTRGSSRSGAATRRCDWRSPARRRLSGPLGPRSGTVHLRGGARCRPPRWRTTMLLPITGWSRRSATLVVRGCWAMSHQQAVMSPDERVVVVAGAHCALEPPVGGVQRAWMRPLVPGRPPASSPAAPPPCRSAHGPSRPAARALLGEAPAERLG